MKSLKRSALLAAGLFLAGSSLAHASTLTFDLTKSLESSFADYSVAKLTISDLIGGGTHWTLTTNWGSSYSSAFVKSLDYNYTGTGTITSSNYKVLTGTVTAPTFGNGPAHTSAVNFQVSNTGGGRFNTGESVSWNFSNSKATDFQVNYIQVNAINNGSSVRFAPGSPSSPVSPVPEPSTYAMLLAGLAAIALMRRRKQA